VGCVKARRKQPGRRRTKEDEAHEEMFLHCDPRKKEGPRRTKGGGNAKARFWKGLGKKDRPRQSRLSSFEAYKRLNPVTWHPTPKVAKRCGRGGKRQSGKDNTCYSYGEGR